MSVFMIVATCLVVAALLFVIPPLFRRDEGEELERREVNISIYKNQMIELDEDLAAGDITQEHYDKSRQEIERRLLEDASVAEAGKATTNKNISIASALVVLIAVPVASSILYSDLGNQAALNPENHKQPTMAGGNSPHGDTANMAAQIEAMVAGLAQRLEQNPEDIEGWVMLARSFSVLGRYQEAAQAYEKSIQFVGDNPDILSDYADAMAMANGGSLEGKPMTLLQRAVGIDPNHQKAFWLLGTGLFERGDFVGAIEHWEHLKNLLPADSEDAAAIRDSISEAGNYLKRQQNGEFGPAPKATTLADTMSGAGSAAIAAITAKPAVKAKVSGVVTVDAALAGKFSPDDTLFVFAKAVNGPPMPLAIVKAKAADLPLEFSLDESMAMMPSMSMAKYREVSIGARIAKGGDAIAKAGDLEGEIPVVAVGSEGLELHINSVIQ